MHMTSYMAAIPIIGTLNNAINHNRSPFFLFKGSVRIIKIVKTVMIRISAKSNAK